MKIFTNPFANSPKAKAAFQLLKGLNIAGFLAIIAYSWKFFLNGYNEVDLVSFLYTIASAVLIGGASIAIGGLLGFLFAIPRNVQENHTLPANNLNQNINQSNSKTPRYTANDNLVQISDWLTKIFVGVGLTQIYRIPPKLQQLGTALAPILGNGSGANIFGICLVVYFLIVGFLIGYLWTRLNLMTLFEESDREAIRATEIENEELKGENEEIKRDLINQNFKPEDVKEARERKLLTKSQPSSLDNLDDTDPQKGKWGGKPENGNRKLSAKVKPVFWSRYFFNVILVVESTDKSNYPLQGTVQFHLHPTYKNDTPIVKVKEGIAELKLLAWGAFTVGVETDNGLIKLELDLAELADAPEIFRSS